jgi:hypothetical protein
MRKRLTLTEEINRMKGLMIYTNGDYKTPIIEDDKNTKKGIKPGPSYNSGNLNIKFKGGKYDIEAAGGLPKIKEQADKLKQWLKENPKLKNKKIQINVNAGSSYYWRRYKNHSDVLKKTNDEESNKKLTQNRANAGLDAIKAHFPVADYPLIKIVPVENANIGKYWGDVRKEAIDKAKKEGKTGSQLNTVIAEAWKKWITENRKNQYVSITAGVSSDDDTPEPKKEKPCKECPDGSVPKRDPKSKDCLPCPKEKEKAEEEKPEEEKPKEKVVKEVKKNIQECWKKMSKFNIEYGNKQKSTNHKCSKAVWEVYANGQKLSRKTNTGKNVEYVSLNNTNSLADDATVKNKEFGGNSKGKGGSRKNVVEITDIDRETFMNLDNLKKYKGNLEITLKCISGTNTNTPPGYSKWPGHTSTEGCHKDVAGISYEVDGKPGESNFAPPYKPGETKTVYSIEACKKEYNDAVKAGVI